MVFDVESVGLHGEGFAVGYVVIDDFGKEYARGLYSCPPREAFGFNEKHYQWINEHVPDLRPHTHENPHGIREAFWRDWEDYGSQGALLVADCPWPVEARFLQDCIAADIENREFKGPYPLIDVASVRLAAGLDPLGTEERRANELPIHNPLSDARQSARLLIEALELVREVEE